MYTDFIEAIQLALKYELITKEQAEQFVRNLFNL